MILTKRLRREGTVVVVAAVCMIGILAVVALSLDGGMVLDKRRQVQSAADAAAYAGASELFAVWFTNGGKDNGPLPGKTGPAAGTMATFVKHVARDNQYEDGVDDVTVAVHIPPTSGLFVNQAGHCEVIISSKQARGFSTIFGSREKITIGARAVARGKRTTVNNGIIVLKPTGSATLSLNGNGNSTVTGSASVIVDSNDAGSTVSTGGSAHMTAVSYDLSGNPGISGADATHFVGTKNTSVPPTPDPLRFIPQPDPSTMTVQSTKKINHSGASALTLNPGVYIGGISITGKGNVVLNPGIYYMQGGGFSTSGQGSLTGSGVMIFNAPTSNSDTISLAGSGAITLSPPTSGPYQGISLFQSRTATTQPTVSVTGNGTAPLAITGTFYAPNALLSVVGNGTQDTIGSQYISNTLSIGGNGSFNVDWNPNVVPGIRQVWLVE